MVETVVQRVLRVGSEADVGRREDADHVVVGDPARELDDVGEIQLRRESSHLLEHVAATDEDRAPVVAPRAQIGERAERMVDAVLRAHHAEIGEQVRLEPRSAGSGGTCRKRSVSGALRTTKTSSGRLRPRLIAISRYDSFVAITTSASRNASRSRDAASRGTADPVAAEPGEEELGHEVVVVEDERGAAPARRKRRAEQRVRRVAGVDDVEAAPSRCSLRMIEIVDLSADAYSRDVCRAGLRPRREAGSDGSRCRR